jgi:hypothetical protein
MQPKLSRRWRFHFPFVYDTIKGGDYHPCEGQTQPFSYEGLMTNIIDQPRDARSPLSKWWFIGQSFRGTL